MKAAQAWKETKPPLNCSWRLHEPLAQYTTYQIGGPADITVYPSCVEDVQKTANWCKSHNIPVVILGRGSNVLAPDEGFAGLVMIFRDSFSHMKQDREQLIAQAGASDHQLAVLAAEHGFAPFSFLYDIPGSVGGAVVQNAGMNEYSVASIVQSVTHLNPQGDIQTSNRDELQLTYRSSIFKKQYKNHIVLSASFIPQHTEAPNILHKKNEQLRHSRQSKYPMHYPNCGSVFKRPPGDYAGRLIEAAACGGMQIGAAQVSKIHHNFIVNTGQATAKQVQSLIQAVQERVHSRSGITLERELLYFEELKLYF